MWLRVRSLSCSLAGEGLFSSPNPNTSEGVPLVICTPCDDDRSNCTTPGTDLGCNNRAVELALPKRAADGSCGDEQLVPFLREIAPFNCSLAPPSAPLDLQSECSYSLNTSFLEALRISPTPDPTASQINVTLFVANASTAYETVATVPPSVLANGTGGLTCYDAMVGYQ